MINVNDTKSIMIGKKVQSFYNEIPFPDFDLNRFENKEDLILNTYPFAKILDRSIPQGARIIDVGCGTGQLIGFLSLRHKAVGIDFSETSLNKAKALKEKLKLDSLHLKKVDITDLNQIKELGKFDYVLCLGVLHHTKDAYQSFKNILYLLKPDGKIGIGLYNKIGRIPLQIRKFLSKTIFKNNQQIKEGFIRMQIGYVEDKERARGWWNDQYNHPYETTHRLGQVLKWFKKNSVRYIQTIPSSTLFEKSDIQIAGVWNDYREKYPYFPIRSYKQLTWLWETQREGGYWMIFGERK